MKNTYLIASYSPLPANAIPCRGLRRPRCITSCASASSRGMPWRNQRHALEQWPVHIAPVLTQFTVIIADFDTRIAELDRAIAQNLKEGAWAVSATLLASIPGLDPTTCAWLLVATINFTVASTPQSLAAYAGLAPMDRQSATSVRGHSRIGGGGHRRLRKALHLATLTAACHNPIIRPFYTRLREAGKPFKVAQCAAARKLLTVAWAVVTKGCRFDPQHRAGD